LVAVVKANNQSLVPAGCLKKTKEFVSIVRGETIFDHAEMIAADVHTNMSLSEFNVCETKTLRMTSILFTQSDHFLEDKVYLPRAGPRLTNCRTEKLSISNQILKARVFREDGYIVGFGLKFSRPDFPMMKVGFGTLDY